MQSKEKTCKCYLERAAGRKNYFSVIGRLGGAVYAQATSYVINGSTATDVGMER